MTLRNILEIQLEVLGDGLCIGAEEEETSRMKTRFLHFIGKSKFYHMLSSCIDELINK